MARRNAKQISAFHKFFQRIATIPQSILDHWKCYQTGYVWFLLTCLFALLVPMMAKLAIPSLDYDLSKFLSGGDIALFSMVIVTSLVIDHFVFDENFSKMINLVPSGSKYESEYMFNRVFIFVFPMFAIISCLLIYLRCQALSCQALSCFEFVTFLMEITMFLSVAAYAAYIKTSSFSPTTKTTRSSQASCQT